MHLDTVSGSQPLIIQPFVKNDNSGFAILSGFSRAFWGKLLTVPGKSGPKGSEQIFDFPLDILEHSLYSLGRTNVFFPAGTIKVRFLGHRPVYTAVILNAMEGRAMKTVYYQTSHFIRHTGNIIDLEELRRRQALAQRDSLARQPEVLRGAEEPEELEETGFQPVVLTLTLSQRRRARRDRRAWTLDACASLAVVFMTLVFALRVMF